MMKTYDELVKLNHNSNRPYIPDHPCRISIIVCSGSCKIDALLNLIKHQRLDIDKTYLYVKDPFEANYQLFIYGREKAGNKKIKNHSLIVHKQLVIYMETWKIIIQQ